MRWLLTTVLLLALAPAASAADQPPQRGVGIDVLNINGSGCRQGTVAVALSADNTAFTVTYSAYTAVAGGSAGKQEASRDCRLNLKITPPAGFAFAVDSIDYRGFAELSAGATATRHAVLYVNGTPRPPEQAYVLTGPYSDDWQVTEAATGSALALGACSGSRVLSVDTRLTATPGTDPGATTVLTMDSIDGTVRTTYRLSWQRC